MKVSVIISTYNRPDQLRKAIESVQKQTYADWELIVVYDIEGKTEIIEYDKTPKDSKIKHVSLGEHFGNDTKPKNKGILEAKGEFIALLDDDNQWRPDHLAVLVPELEKDSHLAGVYGDRMVYQDGQAQGIGTFHDFDPFLLARKNYIDASDMLIRRDVLMAVGGFDERYGKYVDWNLWLRVVKAGYNFKRVPVILTDYYRSKEGKSFKHFTKNEQRFKEENGGKFVNMPDWDPIELEVRLPFLGAVKPPRVAVFSLTYDRLEYTKACFESLYKTAGYEFDHYVVDNGSTDGTIEWLDHWYEQHKGQVILIKNPKNEGISRGSNFALAAMRELDEFKNGPYDIIVKYDNDCLAQTDGWLKQMVQIWEKNHRIALSCYVNGLRDNPGGAPRLAYGQLDGTLIGMTRHLGGICHFVDAKAYQDFRWDEGDFLHGNQDLEFSQHLSNAGYQMGYLENFFVEHYEGTEGQHKRFPDYFERRKEEKRTRYETSQ